MTSQGVMRVENSGLSSHGGKVENNYLFTEHITVYTEKPVALQLLKNTRI